MGIILGGKIDEEMLVTFLEMWGSTGACRWDVTEKICGTSGHK